jgi:glycosyltransferase involved in cell wall biosynthesis
MIEKIQNDIPDISIVIPIYNVEKYLSECLESVINQSKEDIEIICIDDCSTDGSLEIAEKFAEIDSRIRIIRNHENRGQLYARKVGVLNAKGKYIMFLDSDDFYSLDACKIACEQILDKSVDVLQFGINIINKGKAPQYEVDSFTSFVIPYLDKLDGSQVLKYCFDDEKYNYNLFNKIYKSNLCKTAFEMIDDNRYYMAEDMLAYFVISYFAQSYYGIDDKLYNYNFAIGISKPGELNLDGLSKRCEGAVSIAAVERFLIRENAIDQYSDILKKMERRILSDNFDAWYYRLPSEYREQGYHIFEKYWGKDKVIRGLLYDIENKQCDINHKGMIIEDNKRELERINNELRENESIFKTEYNNVINSLSYKIGRFITWIPRKIAKIFF